MKSTGIVRRVDSLGRIVLPIELRNVLNISPKDSLEIYIDGSSVVLRKYAPQCVFCDSMDDMTTFKGRNVCRHCVEEMARKDEVCRKEG